VRRIKGATEQTDATYFHWAQAYEGGAIVA
jgi:hypothetical protein